ncbi:MAG: aminotransferase DegT [Planctomycetota bacterium]|nr:MAG: aminotransferase DegT [Planctomycetota bacterium]
MLKVTDRRSSSPVRRVPVCAPVLDGRERAYVLDALDSGWVSSQGEYIDRFEQAWARACGAAHGVACCNGTAALHLALKALGVGPGDEVLIPAFTLIASANMVHLAGAKPVLVDVRPDTWCIDPRRIREKITPRTRAIMPVHMYGHPCDMDPILAIAREHGLYVIEDAAQAHGATYQGRPVGGFGDAACFSFYGNKIITCGEGGMVLVQDVAVAERLRLLRNQAFGPVRFVHDEVGFNYRLTNLQAAIGLAQVERIQEKLARKRAIAERYDALLKDVEVLRRPVELRGCRNVYWMYGVVLEEAFGRTRGEVMTRLVARGVETRSFFIPMNQQPVFDGRDPHRLDLRGRYPVSEHLGACGLYLPSGEGLTEAEQDYVVEQLRACQR